MRSIGPYIRENVIPAGMSVSEAARRLGVGRPALSNLLNGNAALSNEMALKFQNVFKADSRDLMRRQAELENEGAAKAVAVASARHSAAGYLKITSSQIAEWAKREGSRSLLPVLVRRLVNATGREIFYVDFPGYEDGQRRGWDGQTKTAAPSPWVPEGAAGWELSCSADLPGKPDRDIRARSKLGKSEKRDTTFIFVTARLWNGKDEWVREQLTRQEWRDVQVYDARTLEQWLEQSATTQIWFAEQIGHAPEAARSLDSCWTDWSLATEPKLSPKLLDDAVSRHRKRLWDWLSGPSNQPLVVAADSQDEALAFLSRALLEEDGQQGKIYTGTIVVHTAEALRKVGPAMFGGTIVVAGSEAELAASPFFEKAHIIIVRPRSSVENEPDIALDQIEDDAFIDALAEMGFDRDEAERLAAESGHSATILRRRLARSPELKSPTWAKDAGYLRKLLPMFLAGAWNKSVEADRIILTLLADQPYEQLEQNLADLLAVPDSPVWAVGNYRGIISRKDALFAAKGAFAEPDIERFFEIAELVLSEDDPSLDLEIDKRWTASIYGKTRQISGALRYAIGELLVLLSLYGEQLMGSRVDGIPYRVERLVRRLLEGRGVRSWLAQRNDLPLLAEAAPEAFLDVIEADLASDEPQILPMLRPVNPGGMDSPDRTGLLWALENIGWDANLVTRVIRILARLSQIPIEDNWVNKPQNSLQSLVRAWWPQTAASIETRMQMVEAVAREFPDVGWRLCSEQVGPGHRFASANSRPKWRLNGASRERRPPHSELYQMGRKCLDLLLAWPELDHEKLSSLLRLQGPIPDKDRRVIWRRADEWLASDPSDEEREALREAVRTNYGYGRAEDQEKPKIKAWTEGFLARLVPDDVVIRNKWLFAEHYVRESRAEILAENFDYEKRQASIEAKRSSAVAEIYSALGINGIERLLNSGNARSAVGFHLAGHIRDFGMRAELVRDLIVRSNETSAFKDCLSGFFHKLTVEERANLVGDLITGASTDLTDDEAVLLFTLMPFGADTWDLLERDRPDLSAAYWRDVLPNVVFDNVAELSRVIERLLEAGRARAAFAVCKYELKKLESPTILRLLKELPRSEEPTGTYPLDSHWLSDALMLLFKRKAAPTAELAQLEYLYVSALRHSEHGLPNLEKQIAESPADFVHLVSLMYKRSDGGIDPPELTLPDDANREAIYHNVYHALDVISRIPGCDDDGIIDTGKTLEWVRDARARFLLVGRRDIGDNQIGELLSNAPAGADGVWPHEAVRLVLEEMGTVDMSRGLEIGIYNSRGAVWRKAGGTQERELAQKYTNWSKSLEGRYPFTAKMLANIANKYVREAEWHDTDEAVRKRLGR